MPSTSLEQSAAKQPIKAYPLKFTGSGGQYFRVWLVNILLTALTLGIYTPWARRRTADYFFSHSVIARSPLEFSVSIKRMVIGFFIFVGLYLVFNWALESNSTLVVFLALFSAATAIPYLWGSAKRFRVTATRWRGLRLRFATNWKEIYWASWPVFVVALLWFLTYVGIDMIQTFTTPSLLEEEQADQPRIRIGIVGWALVVISLIVTLLCVIRVDYNYRRLLVNRTYLGQEPGVWKSGYGEFVRIWLSTIAIFVGTLVLTGGIFGAATVYAVPLVYGEEISAIWQGVQAAQETLPEAADEEGGAWGSPEQQTGAAEVTREPQEDGQEPQNMERYVMFGVLAVLLGYFGVFVAFSVARAYREARLHRLVWSNVGISDIARFRSDLGVWKFVWLRIQNLLLTMLTLGLYRPFARVREYRAKWNSTSIHIKGGVTQVKGLLVIQQEGGGLADAIADYAGFDIVG